MLYGIPNITTSIGAEGMKGNFDWNGFIEDDDEKFIEKSLELYQNGNLWKTAQQNGYEILEKRFGKSDFEPALKNVISEIENHLQSHRNQNFLGQILQHQTLNSTKYMSKWIEEKNRS